MISPTPLQCFSKSYAHAARVIPSNWRNALGRAAAPRNNIQFCQSRHCPASASARLLLVSSKGSSRCSERVDPGGREQADGQHGKGFGAEAIADRPAGKAA
jgi:hypothetical protein